MFKVVLKHIYIGLTCGLFALLFSLLPVTELVELKGYDFLHSLKRFASPPENIVIVAIDEPSFAEIKKQWPWPRSLHAKLVESLDQAGASVIGFDILFPEPSEAPEDTAFSNAIKQAGNVVLASDINIVRGRQFEQVMLIDPIPAFKDYSYTGITSLPLDRDYVVRRLPHKRENLMLFSEQIANLHSQKTLSAPKGGYISYASAPNSFTTVSYYQALAPDQFLPENFFKDKIVIVGKAASASTNVRNALLELFATPFLSVLPLKSLLMSGVEIHANIVNNFLKNDFVTRLDLFSKILLFLFIGIVGSFLQVRWRPVLSGLTVVFFFILYIFIAYYIFEKYRLWMPTFSLIIPFSVAYGIFGISKYIIIEKQKKEIKKVFSHYLSPAVLESVLKDSKNLKLGGQKVEATILFADIANFTSISEKLQPEEVSTLINLYMTEMTSIIFKHSGTMDKFIGDSIMAFWGAPLADPDHALNACRAAVSIREKIKTIKENVKQKNLSEVSIRVGINTGEVIAGNMGSTDLFDYTVLGDAVNLASRLEAANKKFGTCILISEFVYKQVNEKVEVRPLGKISVKGKTEEVEVYELINVTT